MKKRFTTIASVMILAGSLLTGCGNSSSSKMDTSTSYTSSVEADYSNGVANSTYAMSEEMEAASESKVKDSTGQAENNSKASTEDILLLEEKLVYHCDLSIETLDYAATMTAIKDTISRYNGVIQSENESDSSHNWYYADYRKTSATMHNSLHVRIPSDKYSKFLEELNGVGRITSKSTSVDNISQEYYDTTSQIEALQIQEQNLLAMLEKCETIEDMLTVQERLSQIQYELNRLQTNKRYMDTDVAYSYVNINISEVMEYRSESEPIRTNTFMDRLYNTIKSTGRGFLMFLEGLLFLLISLIPYLFIIGVVCFFFRKKIGRIIRQRKEEKAAAEARKQMNRAALMQNNAGVSGTIQQNTNTHNSAGQSGTMPENNQKNSKE